LAFNILNAIPAGALIVTLAEPVTVVPPPPDTIAVLLNVPEALA